MNCDNTWGKFENLEMRRIKKKQKKYLQYVCSHVLNCYQIIDSLSNCEFQIWCSPSLYSPLQKFSSLSHCLSPKRTQNKIIRHAQIDLAAPNVRHRRRRAEKRTLCLRDMNIFKTNKWLWITHTHSQSKP